MSSITIWICDSGTRLKDCRFIPHTLETWTVGAENNSLWMMNLCKVRNKFYTSFCNHTILLWRPILIYKMLLDWHGVVLVLNQTVVSVVNYTGQYSQMEKLWSEVHSLSSRCMCKKFNLAKTRYVVIQSIIKRMAGILKI